MKHLNMNRILPFTLSVVMGSTGFAQSGSEVLIQAEVSQNVPAFWAGGNTWKARYASSKKGDFNWSLECSNRNDKDLHQKRETFTVLPDPERPLVFSSGGVNALSIRIGKWVYIEGQGDRKQDETETGRN